MTDDPVLTRTMIAAGGIAGIVARDAPDIRLWSDEERRQSLASTLAGRPAGPVWLFGYGSLIWNPTIHSEERRVARITGWRRAFCLSTKAGRGTYDNPGLVLGLDHGGSCHGIAFRLAEHQLESELALIWQREMLTGAYVPRWLALHAPDGETFGHAIAFTIDRDNGHYAGALPRATMVHRLATARGALGSSADYLFRTCEGLRDHGIPDDELDRLAAEVRALQQQLNDQPA